MIDNFNVLENSLIKFEDGAYYKFEAIIRNKDGKNSLATNPNSTSLKYWLISAQEEYDKLKPVMIKFCELTGARLYMTLDRKDTKKTFINVSETLFNVLKDMMFGNMFSVHKLSKIIASETSKKESNSKELRTWMIDVDIDDKLAADSLQCFTKDNFICTLKSPNGYHVVCKKKFGADKFLDLFETFLINWTDTLGIRLSEQYINNVLHNISLKENALGLVYKK